MQGHGVWAVMLAAYLATVLGTDVGVLNVTLQLTTPDLLPVSAVVQAASKVWDVKDGDIHILSATAKHAASENTLQPRSRSLLHSKLKVHLDFAKMKEDNPSLLTLKDFLMSSNQAPESESDIQHLMQAFAEYKQGELNSAKASHRLAGHAQPSSQSASGSALHPHLLFLKTGGGSTVAEPKHQLSMQELQTLADSGSTSEGLLPVQTKTPSPSTNTVASKQQLQGPLGTANVVLGTQDESFQRMASLFTPQNDKAIAKALRILEDNDDEPVSQSLFSSLEESEEDLLNAVSGPYDVPEPVITSKLGTNQPDHRPLIDPMLSLSWLDEADRQELHHSIAAQQKLHYSDGLDAGGRPAPPRSVLLSVAISIVSNNTTALQAAIGESIADRQLQQELDRQGYSMVQLDAMFADEGVFSTETEVVSAETADPVQGQAVEQVKVSVRTVVKRHMVSDYNVAKQDDTVASTSGDNSGYDTDGEWAPELLICATGLAVALAIVLLGAYKYSVSRAGLQAQQMLAHRCSTKFWLCGNNTLQQPLIPKHATAEDAC